MNWEKVIKKLSVIISDYDSKALNEANAGNTANVKEYHTLARIGSMFIQALRAGLETPNTEPCGCGNPNCYFGKHTTSEHFKTPPSYITYAYLGSGWAAIMMQWYVEIGGYDIKQTGNGRYQDKVLAVEEGKAWALSEEIEFRSNLRPIGI